MTKVVKESNGANGESSREIEHVEVGNQATRQQVRSEEAVREAEGGGSRAYQAAVQARAFGPDGSINGNGYIRDEAGYRIAYSVEPDDDPQKLTIVLRVAEHITWWKSTSLYVNVAGNWAHSGRIDTKDQNRESFKSYWDFEMTDQFRLEFWKGGVFGFGAFAASIILDSYANLGKRIIFLWEED